MQIFVGKLRAFSCCAFGLLVVSDTIQQKCALLKAEVSPGQSASANYSAWVLLSKLEANVRWLMSYNVVLTLLDVTFHANILLVNCLLVSEKNVHRLQLQEKIFHHLVHMISNKSRGSCKLKLY